MFFKFFLCYIKIGDRASALGGAEKQQVQQVQAERGGAKGCQSQ